MAHLSFQPALPFAPCSCALPFLPHLLGVLQGALPKRAATLGLWAPWMALSSPGVGWPGPPSPELLGGRQQPRPAGAHGPCVPGRAQMEWLWAEGKGQMQPPLEPQLPCYLFIVSLSPWPGPFPGRPSVISTRPPRPAAPAPGLQRERQRGSTPQGSLLWGRAEGRGPWGGWERLGWGAWSL